MVAISRKLKALYTTQAMRQLGSGLLDFFGVMFVYELSNQNLVITLGLYFVLYALYGLLVPLVAQWYGVLSRQRMITFGMLFLVVSYLPFILMPDKLWLVVVLHVIFQVAFRLFYWLPYLVTVTQMMHDGERGRVMGILNVFSSLAMGFAPFVGGWLISAFSFTAMFSVGVVILLGAMIPILFLPRYSHDRFEIPYRGTFWQLFRKKNRRLIIAHSAAGADHVSRLVLWPLVIFLIMDGQYVAVGLLSTLAMLFVLVLRIVTGHYLDAPATKDRIIHWTTKLQALAWILRIFPVTNFQVFLTDAFYRSVESANTLSYEKEVYDHADDCEEHADEYIVLRAVALNMGRLVVLAAAVAVGLLWSLQWVFVLSAVYVLLMNRVQKETKV